MHTLANVRQFLTTATMESVEVAQKTDSDLCEAADERDLLTARDIHRILGQHLAQRYFSWFGQQMQGHRNRTSGKTGGEHASSPG